MSTDFDKRTVVLESMKVPRVNFPDLDDKDMIDKFSALHIKNVESWNPEMSLDRLLAGMSEIEDQKNLSVQLNNEPPEIYFRTSPDVLISIDGEPKLKTDEDSKLEYVLNTPFFIVKDPKKDNYYIRDGKFWYVSEEITKRWQETDYASVEGTSLLFASNSEDDIIMDINSTQHYVLIAGRWYHSKTLNDGDLEICRT